MKKENYIEIENLVKELLNPNLPFSPQQGRIVPTIEHQHLTVNARNDLRSIEINACVMHIDLRDSTNFNQLFNAEITSKVYTAFIRMVLQAASEHNGSVRNIVGDRVMIIFVGENAFKNAIECAISCNSFMKTLQPTFNSLLAGKFIVKAGIGIDYGTMNVVLVGITKRGREGYDNQNLVWLGQPANIASKLTDNAGKNKSKLKYVNSKITSVTENYLPILITDNVYHGLIENDRTHGTLQKCLWNKTSLLVAGKTITVYGGDIYWAYN